MLELLDVSFGLSSHVAAFCRYITWEKGVVWNSLGWFVVAILAWVHLLSFSSNEKTPWWIIYYVGIRFKTVYSLNHQYRYKEKRENMFSPPFWNCFCPKVAPRVHDEGEKVLTSGWVFTAVSCSQERELGVEKWPFKKIF